MVSAIRHQQPRHHQTSNQTDPTGTHGLARDDTATNGHTERVIRLALLELHLLHLGRRHADEDAALPAQVMQRITTATTVPTPTPSLATRLKRWLGFGRRGFTLIEMLVVLAIIAALSGLTYPVVSAWKTRQGIERTQATVQMLAAVTGSYTPSFIPVPPDGHVRPLWDFNQDGLLDGDPRLDPNFSDADRQAADAAGYTGPVQQLALSLRSGSMDQYRRILDYWGRPLRIDRAAAIYGSGGIGIWSTGADDLPGTDDDITSWSTRYAH